MLPEQTRRNQKLNSFKSLINRFLPYMIFAVLSLVILTPIAPHIRVTPSTDSSVFLYIGDRILDGAVPYRDVWDHKGPLIYYIDALGLGLADGSRWGVWFLEFTAVTISAWIGFGFLKRAFGFWPALFAIFLFLVELPLVLDLGNLTEEFALPFQFLLLWLIWHAAETKNFTYHFFIGVTAAFCFLLRPNIIGIPLAIGLTLAWQAWNDASRKNFKTFSIVVTGGLLVLTLTGIYFLLEQSLPQLWDAVFVFNNAYSTEASGNWIQTLVEGFANLPFSTMFGLTGWVFASNVMLNRMPFSENVRQLVRLLVIAVPLEFLLTCLTGNNFPHYYMSWLPALTLSSGFFLFLIVRSLLTTDSPTGLRQRLIAIPLIIVLCFVPLVNLFPRLQASLASALQTGGLPPVELSGHRYEPVLDYVDEYMENDQPLLVWGNQVNINWLTGRYAPTRFVYQTPLFVDSYMTREMSNEIINELEANPPVLIDTGSSDGFLPPLTVALTKLPTDVRPLYNYLQEHFTYAGTFQSTGWDLYLYHGEGIPLAPNQP